MGTKIIPMLQVGKTEAWRGKVTFPRSHSKQVGELGLKTNSGQFQSLCSSAPKLCDLLMNSKVSAPCLVPSKHPVSVGCSDHDNSEDTWAAFAWGSGGWNVGWISWGVLSWIHTLPSDFHGKAHAEISYMQSTAFPSKIKGIHLCIYTHAHTLVSQKSGRIL